MVSVRIYKPSKTAMQSGLAKTKSWVLEYDLASKRSPEPLMGWISSEDTLNQVKVSFKTKEEAILYAESKGWAYTVQSERKKKIVPRNYADNFKYRPAPESKKSSKTK